MSFDSERLWALLPAYLRTRDTALANPAGPDSMGRWRPGPLRQLIDVIASQTAVLEEDLEQLYDNHFVETAAPWALPYLGDLLGIRGLPSGQMAQSPRAEVGHTVAYRRRKGTAAILELLARDSTGWPARAVEYFERLAATQHLNHVRPHCLGFASLRDARNLEWVGTPFEPLTRTVEVRRIQSRRGKWNVPNVGVFLWRLRADAHTAYPLVPVGELWAGDPRTARRYRFHPLGVDASLFSRPETETELSNLASPIHVPLAITRRRFATGAPKFNPTADLYGPGQSLLLEEYSSDDYRPIPRERIVVCDLSDCKDDSGRTVWSYETQVEASEVLVDPALGRLVLGEALLHAARPVRATFHLGSPGNLGGGEYGRAGSFDPTLPNVVQATPDPPAAVSSDNPISEAIELMRDRSGAITLSDSRRHDGPFPSLEARGIALELRAADGRCPTLLIGQESPAGPWTIDGDAAGSISFNGIRFIWPKELSGSGPALLVKGELGRFCLRHCTLAPERFGIDAIGNQVPVPPAYLEVRAPGTEVVIENCILPPLRVNDGVRVLLRNSVVAAPSENHYVLTGQDGNGAAGTWRIENCTIIGNVALGVLELASNSIFLSQTVDVRRRQEGCVRFSCLPAGEGTSTPGRHRCVSFENSGVAIGRPHFTSLRLGQPGYGQLSDSCPNAIRGGADDGGEMGAFHDLFQTQRESHLGHRLNEYLRFGLETGVFHAS